MSKERKIESESVEFKKEVLAKLKYLGYMFPMSEEEVRLFEEKYGTTYVEKPEELNDSRGILAWAEEKLNDETANVYSIAARKSDEIFSKETLDRMKQIHQEKSDNSDV